MNIETGSKMELQELKQILIKSIIKSNELNQMLTLRCDKAKEIIDIYETNIRFEDQVVLKNRDIEKLNLLIKQLSNTIKTTTETELILGATN